MTCAILAALFALAAVHPAVSTAQVSPAGTMIPNTARAAFTVGALADTAASNTVQTRVLAVYGLRISPPGTAATPAFSLAGLPGDTLVCRLTLHNLGNAPDSVAMSHAMLAPSAFAAAGVVFFLDANGNARVDPGEDDPAFLSLAIGAGTPVDAAIVLPPGITGTAHVELRATSARDPGLAAAPPGVLAPASAATVVRVTASDPASTLHVGPAGNPRALPGGTGSPDDETRVAAGPLDDTIAFDNDVENATASPDRVVVYLANPPALPAGVTVSFADTAGATLPSAVAGRFDLGVLAAGEKRRVRTVISTPGTPLRYSLGGDRAFDLVAVSETDTLRRDATVDRVLMPVLPDPRAVIGLDQTFRQAAASMGEVVTMSITATNRTDSIRVDNVRVVETPPAALDFAPGGDARYENGVLAWDVGALGPGESRSTTARFVVNSREPNGWARVSGTASGDADTGDRVSAGPVVASIRVDNDEVGLEGLVLGDVFVDRDGDGARDADERGIANVSLYLESGEHAVTDSLGLFSIPHVFEGRRMVRLDEGSLPPGLEFAVPLAADVHSPRLNERLVHLLAPGHARVSFALREQPVPLIERVSTVACEEKVSVLPVPRRYQSLVLPSSYFALGRAALLRGAERDLAPVAAFLADHPDWNALVEGHTDDQPLRGGRFRSNRELSVARARAVCDALVALGVTPERLAARGYGESRPVASNTTVDGRALNRRVEIAFIPPEHRDADLETLSAVAVRDFSALPDSLRATVMWSLSTTSERAVSGTLRIDLPPALSGAAASVTMRGQPLAREGDAFVFDGFARGTAIECRVAFGVAVRDSAAIRGIAATVALADSAATAGGGERPAVIRPFARGGSTARAHVFDVLAWSEQVPAPKLVPPAPAAPEAAAPDGPVAILEPGEGFVATDRDQVRVRVKHPLGSRVTLLVGGEVVGEEQVGQRTVDVARQEETTTWYGVRLRPGWNALAARAFLLGGGEAGDSVRVALASRPAEIVPLDARRVVPADGHTAGELRFAVRDGFGLPVMDGVVVTVTEGGDLLASPDARPGERGLQAMTREGLVTLALKARHATGGGRIAVEADGMRAETEVAFVTAERPLLATGIVDVNMGVYDTKGDGSAHGLEHAVDGFDAGAEARMFVQGAAPGGFSVTARLDTKKRYDDPLLKQPDPERQYPIFGDASSLHYAAPARGGNYLSIDRGQSYLRYGDLRTPIDRGEFLTYQQTVTGLSTSLTDGANSVRAFVTQTDFITRTDEIPADGTSGFYYLARAPIVENSERVIVETRDRYQPEKVLEARVMTRRRDYTVNPYDGSILFMEPVSATDREFNPNRIVVTYDVESDGADAWLFGVRGDAMQGRRYRAGITAVANGGDEPGYSLFGADGEWRWRGLRLGGEAAYSTDQATGDGGAWKVGALATRGDSKLDLYLRRVDGDFSNPSFRGADSELASVKAGFDGRLAMSKSLSLHADGYTHELQRTDERRETARATMDYRRRLLEMSAGLRVARHDEPSQDQSGVLALAGLTVGSRGSAGVSTTWEQNLGDEIVDDYPNRLKTALAVPLSKRFRAIATHEYLTAAGRASTHQFTAGVEGTTEGGTQAYTRYAMDRTAGDPRMGAVSGIRQKLRLDARTAATIGVEGFLSLSGRDDEEYVSLTTGLSSRAPGSHVIDGGYEYRWETLAQRHLLRLTTAQQLDGGFAWLTKNILGLVNDDERHDGTQFYSTLALSWRSLHAPVQSLAMLKSWYDRYAPVDPEAIRWRLVASADVNILPGAAHEVRLKYAYKHVEDWSYGVSTSTDTDLVLGQYVWHFGRGWDLDAWGRTVVLRGGGTSEYGAGIELGRIVYRSVRVAAGYSINGFDDPDIAGTDARSAGFGIRIQMLLSDWLLADFEQLRK
jgi:outer membrane protein OmpA-like peptidoglycan-associated protein